MGGVRGDVMRLGFIQTTIMEMGQPPSVQAADPAMWVKSRQFTGRIVTVSNSRIFNEPVFNYTRDFPLHLGGDDHPDHLSGRPRAGRGTFCWRRRRSHAIDPKTLPAEAKRTAAERASASSRSI